MANVESQLDQLVLSAHEIKALTGWPSEMIEDYLNIIRNLYTIAGEADLSNDFIDRVNQELGSLAAQIAKAKSEHGRFVYDVASTQQELAAIAVKAARLYSELVTLKREIGGLSASISTNSAQISAERARTNALESMIKKQEQIAHIVRI